MMEFWGIDVKHGGSVRVQPGDDKVVHLSQACLGEVKKDKGNEYVRLFAHKNGQKFVIGILSLEKFPHINLDLVFEDDFELSHDSKHGSVHFAGYKADNPDPMVEEDESDDDPEELIPVDVLNNGKSTAEGYVALNKAIAGVKSETAEGKRKVRIVEPAKDGKKNEGGDETEDDEESEDDDEEEVKDFPSAEAGSEDEEDSDEEEESDEETPKKPELSKKRHGESTSKTPISGKKAKFDTPQQKTEGKKVNVHIATPHPAKHAPKTPANSGKPNSQTPKPAGAFACSSCPRSFGSDQALQSHSKAKHGA